jgi:hypothetical protein
MIINVMKFWCLAVLLVVNIIPSIAQASSLTCKGEFGEGWDNCVGLQKFSDGSMYQGGFTKGGLDGYGLMTMADGMKILSQFKNNQIVGVILLTGVDGSRYVGGFDNNSFNGEGILILPNGERREGDFKEGKLIDARKISNSQILSLIEAPAIYESTSILAAPESINKSLDDKKQKNEIAISAELKSKLSEKERDLLAKMDLLILAKNTTRTNISRDSNNKIIIKSANNRDKLRVNIEAIDGRNWLTQYTADYQGVYVNRRQVMSNVYGKEMTVEFQKRIQKALNKLGLYQFDWGGGALTDEAYATDVQVLLKADLELPAGARYKSAIEENSMFVVGEVSALKIYENVVLNIFEKPNLKTIDMTNNTGEHVVGVFSFDGHSDKFSHLIERDDLMAPGSKFDIKLGEDDCEGPKSLVVMMSDATYFNAMINALCEYESININAMNRYKITGNITQKSIFYNVFYALRGVKFKKTKGQFSNGKLTGRGWTEFHGDYHVSEFKDGYRDGQGTFCTKSGDGYIAHINEYANGYPVKGYKFSMQRNRMNRDPFDGDKPITYEKLFKKVCFWDY